MKTKTVAKVTVAIVVYLVGVLILSPWYDFKIALGLVKLLTLLFGSGILCLGLFVARNIVSDFIKSL